MDKKVVVFRAANPNFVTKYTEVRKIVDPGTLSKAKKEKSETAKKIKEMASAKKNPPLTYTIG